MYPPKPIRGWAGTRLHDRLIGDAGWVCEPKADGDRCLVFALDDGIQLWSRHGRQHRYSWLAPLVEELEGLDLPAGTVLDAELLHEPKPRCDLVVFDVGSSWPQSLSERRDTLERFLARGNPSRVSAAPWLPKSTAYEDALAAGHEGVVFKKLDSPYRWQRGDGANKIPDWVKMKP